MKISVTRPINILIPGILKFLILSLAPLLFALFANLVLGG